MISGRVLVAGIVALAFLILTISLLLARKKRPSLDIPATISAVAGVIAVIGAILLTPDASPVQTPPPTATADLQSPESPEPPSATSTQPMITSPPEKPGGQATPELAFDDWVICWHGRDGYEYLIGYPESSVRAGLDLNIPLKNAQGRELELANDSLKMCLLNGEWYGFPEPSPWFPEVSHIRLVDGGILACSDSPGCQGMQWTLLPEGYFPSGAPELQPPTEAGLHVIAFKRSL